MYFIRQSRRNRFGVVKIADVADVYGPARVTSAAARIE